MDSNTRAKIETAKGIAAHGPNIAYLSRAQAERVRQSIRDLLTIITDMQFKLDCERELSATLSQRNELMAEGRNVAEAALRLKDASPEEIQLIAKHDWDMIRDVAALAAVLLQPRPDLDAMANRFLGWPVPTSVVSDPCMAMKDYGFPRSGTCIMGPAEAKQMLEYLFNHQQ